METRRGATRAPQRNRNTSTSSRISHPKSKNSPPSNILRRSAADLERENNENLRKALKIQNTVQRYGMEAVTEQNTTTKPSPFFNDELPKERIVIKVPVYVTHETSLNFQEEERILAEQDKYYEMLESEKNKPRGIKVNTDPKNFLSTTDQYGRKIIGGLTVAPYDARKRKRADEDDDEGDFPQIHEIQPQRKKTKLNNSEASSSNLKLSNSNSKSRTNTPKTNNSSMDSNSLKTNNPKAFKGLNWAEKEEPRNNTNQNPDQISRDSLKKIKIPKISILNNATPMKFFC